MTKTGKSNPLLPVFIIIAELFFYFNFREFDTLKSKKVPQSLEIGLFFCQIFIFII